MLANILFMCGMKRRVVLLVLTNNRVFQTLILCLISVCDNIFLTLYLDQCTEFDLTFFSQNLDNGQFQHLGVIYENYSDLENSDFTMFRSDFTYNLSFVQFAKPLFLCSTCLLRCLV
jgi:hypothetical protein